MTEGAPEKIPSPAPAPAPAPAVRTEPPAGAPASGAAAPAAAGDWRKHIRSGAIVLGAAVAIIVLFQNTQDTTLELLFWERTAPLWFYLVLHFVAGAGAALIGQYIWRKRRARRPDAK